MGKGRPPKTANRVKRFAYTPTGNKPGRYPEHHKDPRDMTALEVEFLKLVDEKRLSLPKDIRFLTALDYFDIAKKVFGIGIHGKVTNNSVNAFLAGLQYKSPAKTNKVSRPKRSDLAR